MVGKKIEEEEFFDLTKWAVISIYMEIIVHCIGQYL